MRETADGRSDKNCTILIRTLFLLKSQIFLPCPHVSCSNVNVAYKAMKAKCVPTINVYRYSMNVNNQDSSSEEVFSPLND